ncbi:hypothetical protein BGZ95_005451, partial [Linnemannia exigua]
MDAPPTAPVPAAGNVALSTSNEPLNPLRPQLVQDSQGSNYNEDDDEIGDDLEFDDPTSMRPL